LGFGEAGCVEPAFAKASTSAKASVDKTAGQAVAGI
jgi:hypothetical protein